MKIDRARALMFVGLLAASGCVITTEDDDDDNGNGEAGAPAKGGDTSSGGSSSGGEDSGALGGAAGAAQAGEGGEPGAEGGAAGAAGAGGAMEAGAGGEPAVGGSPAGGAPATGGAGTTGGTPGTGGTNTSGSGGGGGTGPSCDDSAGTPTGCESVEFPDSTCEGEAIIQRALCDAAATNFKPRIAEEIEQCIALQTEEELCEPELTSLCAEQSILGSCPDDEAAVDACVQIATACDAVDDTECLLYLSALTDTGKTWMIACMEEGLVCDLRECAGLP